MPLMNGIESGRRLKELLPITKIIVLTAWENPALAAETTSTWASGYLVKKIPATELILAIRRVIGGEKYIASCIQEKLKIDSYTGMVPDPAKQLTSRQREIVHVLAEGKTIKEAGSILALSSSTICYHKYKIMKSLGIRNNADLVRLAIKERLSLLQ
jgi:DNA-binding NarL/FixJ family response regulator